MQRGCLMLLISLCCIIGNLHKFTLQLLLLKSLGSVPQRNVVLGGKIATPIDRFFHVPHAAYRMQIIR